MTNLETKISECITEANRIISGEKVHHECAAFALPFLKRALTSAKRENAYNAIRELAIAESKCNPYTGPGRTAAVANAGHSAGQLTCEISSISQIIERDHPIDFDNYCADQAAG